MPIVYTAYYMSLFALSLGVLGICFEIRGKEILFGGVCGYALQHMGFALSMIIQEVGGWSLTGIWDFLFFRILP